MLDQVDRSVMGAGDPNYFKQAGLPQGIGLAPLTAAERKLLKKGDVRRQCGKHARTKKTQRAGQGRGATKGTL
jgi:hypothetical protein